jgi:hypothetical protein
MERQCICGNFFDVREWSGICPDCKTNIWEVYVVEKPKLPDNCPQHLKEWWESKTSLTERTKLRLELYENYYDIFRIKESDRWKVNLRKQITKIK